MRSGERGQPRTRKREREGKGGDRGEGRGLEVEVMNNATKTPICEYTVSLSVSRVRAGEVRRKTDVEVRSGKGANELSG